MVVFDDSCINRLFTRAYMFRVDPKQRNIDHHIAAGNRLFPLVQQRRCSRYRVHVRCIVQLGALSLLRHVALRTRQTQLCAALVSRQLG